MFWTPIRKEFSLSIMKELEAKFDELFGTADDE